MNRIVAVSLPSIVVLGLLSACGDSKSASSSTVSDSAPTGTGFVFPEETSTVPGANPSGATVPQATIDLMISQFEANGLKVDKACFTALLKDPAMIKLVEASSGGTPTPEIIQKFVGCIGT